MLKKKINNLSTYQIFKEKYQIVIVISFYVINEFINNTKYHKISIFMHYFYVKLKIFFFIFFLLAVLK